jgi:hypothetical protein
MAARPPSPRPTLRRPPARPPVLGGSRPRALRSLRAARPRALAPPARPRRQRPLCPGGEPDTRTRVGAVSQPAVQWRMGDQNPAGFAPNWLAHPQTSAPPAPGPGRGQGSTSRGGSAELGSLKPLQTVSILLAPFPFHLSWGLRALGSWSLTHLGSWLILYSHPTHATGHLFSFRKPPSTF